MLCQGVGESFSDISLKLQEMDNSDFLNNLELEDTVDLTSLNVSFPVAEIMRKRVLPGTKREMHAGQVISYAR